MLHCHFDILTECSEITLQFLKMSCRDTEWAISSWHISYAVYRDHYSTLLSCSTG